MKQKLTIILSAIMLVFVCLFIYSCQEDNEQSNANTTVVPDDLLSAAKEWHSQNTQGNSNNRLSNASQNVLPPIWKDAALNKLKNGKTQIVVPSVELPLDARSTIGVVRKFVFDHDNEKIRNARIIEIYADGKYMAVHRKNLLERYESGDLRNFTGAVIEYDVNYIYLGSFDYKNGIRIPGSSRISPKAKLPTDEKSGSLRTLECTAMYWVYRDQYGNPLWQEFAFNYCDNNNEYGGGSPNGGGPSANPQNGERYTVTDNEGTRTTFQFSSQLNTWIPVERMLPVVAIVAQKYPLLVTFQWPEYGQVVYEYDGLQYIYQGGSWNGVLNTPQTWEDQIIDQDLNPCIQSILANFDSYVSNESKVGQVLQKFSGAAPGFNWEMKQGLLDTNVNAGTSTAYNRTTGTVTTTFDATKMANATDLSIVRTILHESIHAYVIAASYNSFTADQKEVLLGPDWGTVALNQGHDYITNNYMKPIADALQEYWTTQQYGAGNPNQLDRQFFEDLAWGGLMNYQTPPYNETALFLQLVPNSVDRTRIRNTINVELTGNDINGTPQPKQGRNAGC